jgi:hypothetical protein
MWGYQSIAPIIKPENKIFINLADSPNLNLKITVGFATRGTKHFYIANNSYLKRRILWHFGILLEAIVQHWLQLKSTTAGSISAQTMEASFLIIPTLTVIFSEHNLMPAMPKLFAACP